MSEKKKGMDLSVVLALVAVLISVCTMVISLVETSIMQKQQNAMTESSKAAVWPYVDINIGVKMEGTAIRLEAKIINKGVGPAMIKNTILSYNGNTMEGSVLDFIKKDCPEAKVVSVSSNKNNNSVLSPNESKTVLSVSLVDTDFMEFAKFTEKFGVRYCYSNIYGDLWTSTDSTPVSTKVCR